MSKLNTDANKKEFIKKFTIAWNTPTERWRIPADPGHVWNWTDQSLQQAYQKGYMEGWKDEVFLKSELKKK